MTLSSTLSRVAALGVLFYGAVSCSGDGPTGNDDPGVPTTPAPATFALDVIRSGTLQTGAPTEFRARVPAQTLLRLMFRTTSGVAADTIRAALTRFNGTDTLGVLTSAGTQLALEDLQLLAGPFADSIEIRLSLSKAAGTAAVGFSFVLLTPGGQPERVSDSIAYGDTVTAESLDGPLDQDLFYFDGQAGDEVIIYLGTTLDQPDRSIVTKLYGVNGLLLREAIFDAEAASLDERGAQVLLPTTGRYTIDISRIRLSASIRPAGYIGPYQLWLHKLSRLPESAPQIIVPGDTITEALDVVGDIDEFRLQVVEGQELHINLSSTTEMSEGFVVQLDGQTIFQPDHTQARMLSLDTLGTGLWRVQETGEHVLRIIGPARTTRALGTTTYRIELYEVAAAPETLAPAFSLDTPVSGERIDRPGDMDAFTISLDSGQIVNLFLEAPELRPDEKLFATLVSPTGGRATIGALGETSESSSFSGPYTIPRSGPWQLQVRGVRAAFTPYSFTLNEIDNRPETVDAQLPVNTWVTGERIDEPGDIDRFSFDARPGFVYGFEIRETDPSDPIYWLATSIPGLGTFSKAGQGVGATTYGFAGPFTVTDSGPQLAQVEVFPNNTSLRNQPGYDLFLAESTIMPETADSLIVLGVPVTTERIDRTADRDEFVFDAEGNAQYRITVTIPATPDRVAGLLVRLEFQRFGATVNISGPSPQSPGSDANLQIFGPDDTRVRVILSGLDGRAVGAYSLLVERLP